MAHPGSPPPLTGAPHGLLQVTATQETQPPAPRPTDPLPLGGIVLALAIMAALFLPVLISLVRHRIWLQILSLLFCVLALLAGGGTVVVPLLGALFAPVVWGGLWGMGLMCGIAAAIDGMAERRERKAMRLPPPGRSPMAPRL